MARYAPKFKAATGFVPKYATSFAVGGGIGERAMKQFDGLDPASLKTPENEEEWNEAAAEYDVVHPPRASVDPQKDPSVLRSVAETGMDTLLGIPRGIIGAGMGVWQLADWFTLDLLPDWKNNPLGRSKTHLGTLVEGLTNFATGFVPIVGWMGRAGRVRTAYGATKYIKTAAGVPLKEGSKIAKGLRKYHAMGGRAAAAATRIPTGGPIVKSVFGQKYLSIANQARLETQGYTNAARRVKYSRWLAASVATDFVVWRAHEDRFSNWLQQFPGMQKPVFEYLAADEDDGELHGRMKNVFEGLLFEAGIGGIAGVVKGTLWGVKAMKRGKAAKDAGGSPADVQAAMDSTPNKPEPAEVVDGATEARNLLTENENSPRPEAARTPQPIDAADEADVPTSATAREPATAYTTSIPVKTQEQLKQTLLKGKKVWRGEKGEGAAPADAGDFGSGRYSSTAKSRAEQYGKVRQITIRMNNPLILTQEEAYDQIAQKYGTISGVAGKDAGEVIQQGVEGSRATRSKEAMEALRAEGYDGLILVDVRKGKHAGEVEFVEFPPSKATDVPTSTTTREPGAAEGVTEPILDPEGLDATTKFYATSHEIASEKLKIDGRWGKDRRTTAKTEYQGRADTQLQETVQFINRTLDKLEEGGAPNIQTLRNTAATVEGNSRQKLQQLNRLIKSDIVPLQTGTVRYASVAPHQRMKPRDTDMRLDKEQQLVDLQKHAINARTYKKTLMNLLEDEKQPGRRVDVPNYKGDAWRKMTYPQQVRELRKRILDAEYGYLPHGPETTKLTLKQSRMLGNITRGIIKNLKMYDATGKLNVHEIREHLDSLHDDERAYLKGLVGLPGGRSNTGETTALLGRDAKEGSGEFSEGLAGDHQKRILATALEHANDPNFRPDVAPHAKLTTADWENFVEDVWENNDIDLTNVEQVQKAFGYGEDLADAAATAARLTHVMKILQQGYYYEVSKMSEKYLQLKKSRKTKEAHALGSELIASFFNLNILSEQWVRSGAMTGAALQARKSIDITEYLKNHDYIDKGMDDIVNQLDMLVTSGMVPDEVIQQYKRSMSLHGKLRNAGIEVWTNALISGPKTIFGVTTVGNVFGSIYFPLERLSGHAIAGGFAKLTGNPVRAAKEFKELQIAAKLATATVLQSNYTIRSFSRSLTSNRARSIPGSSKMDTSASGPNAERQALSAEAFWSPEAGARNRLGHWEKTEGHWDFKTTQTGAILDYIGGALNLPGRTMRAMDEVFKTAVTRSVVESEAAAQSLKYIVHGKLGSKAGGVQGLWARTTGEGRETVKDSAGKLDLAKREQQDLQLEKDWAGKGPKAGEGKYSDEMVLFEEITAEVDGKMYKMIDENGTVYTKARVHEDMLQKVMAEAQDDPSLIVGGQNFKNRLTELVEQEWNPQIGAIGAEAEKMALSSTWQTTLTKGGITHSIQKLAQTHPYLRLIFPFIKTPRNLLKFVGDRNPVNPRLYLEYVGYQKAAKAALEENAEQAYRSASRKSAELLGRISMSVAFTTTASYLAYSGVITGSGPKNYAARKNLQASGWQPYSFRIGDKYYSYARAEPISSYLGIMADIVEISNHTYDMDYGETPFEMVTKGVIASLANNVTDKTYMMGLSNVLNALQEPERYVPRVLMSYLTSAVPFSSFMYQTKGTYNKVVNEEDMYFRKSRGFLDPYREKTGWNNAKVPLAYDLMGKPVKKPHGHWPSLGPATFDWVNPFTVSQKVNDPVYQAINEMKLNDGPPKAMIRGRIDTRDEYREGADLSFYDAWQESTGNLKIHGRTLHEAMDRLVRHKDWKHLPKVATEGIDSPAKNLFRSIIQKYRRAAFNRTMDEYPVTRNKYLDALEVQRQLRQTG